MEKCYPFFTVFSPINSLARQAVQGAAAYYDKKVDDSSCPSPKKRRQTVLRVKVKVTLANCVKQACCPKKIDNTGVHDVGVYFQEETTLVGECVDP